MEPGGFVGLGELSLVGEGGAKGIESEEGRFFFRLFFVLDGGRRDEELVFVAALAVRFGVGDDDAVLVGFRGCSGEGVEFGEPPVVVLRAPVGEDRGG